MADQLNSVATHNLPSFIVAPGDTDVLMVVMIFVLIGAVWMFGILFFRLHTLPERMAHKSQKLQFEIVAVLGLIALFTHMHIFWLIGLILALVELPDFGTPLRQIAQSVAKLADTAPDQEAASAGRDSTEADVLSRQVKLDPAAMKPELVKGSKKELGHA